MTRFYYFPISLILVKNFCDPLLLFRLFGNSSAIFDNFLFAVRVYRKTINRADRYYHRSLDYKPYLAGLKGAFAAWIGEEERSLNSDAFKHSAIQGSLTHFNLYEDEAGYGISFPEGAE